MKNLVLLTLIYCLASTGFAKNPVEKTFLIIFNKEELKEFRTSAEYIELSFLEEFDTRAYSGNSDSALFIKIPNCDFDKCQFGQTMVQVNQSTWKPIQEVAFRIIDLSETKASYKALLTDFYQKIDKKKARAIRSVL